VSKLNIIDDEIKRRTESIVGFIKAEEDLLVAIEQFNELDEFYREQEKTSRDTLECIYGENRHFSGEWPLIYQFAEVELRPYFKDTDDICNPYFPASKVKDGTFDGIAPFYAPPTKVGDYQRQRTFAETEDIPRDLALIALQAFPNYQLPDSNSIGEWFPANWPAAQQEIITPGYCTPSAFPNTEAQCSTEGGIWTPESTTPVPDPTWVSAETATALLRVKLDPWKTDLISIRDDVCDDTTEVDYWQALIDDIDVVLAQIQIDPTFIRATGNSDPAAWGRTPDFTNGSPEDLARDRLVTAANTGIPAHVASRKAKLETDAATEEQVFFGLMGLRLHQVNGSYSKLEAAKDQQGQSAGLIADSEKAISSLNLMKVKNS